MYMYVYVEAGADFQVLRACVLATNDNYSILPSADFLC